MYRKIVRTVFFTLMLSGCKFTASHSTDFLKASPPIYSDFEALTWNELFSIQDENYFAYIFSKTCFHCLSIEKDICDFANNSVFPLYFIEFNSEIPIGNNIEETIGLNSIEGVFIKGTPTLILISERAIQFNIAGAENILQTISLYRK